MNQIALKKILIIIGITGATYCSVGYITGYSYYVLHNRSSQDIFLKYIHSTTVAEELFDDNDDPDNNIALLKEAKVPKQRALNHALAALSASISLIVASKLIFKD